MRRDFRKGLIDTIVECKDITTMWGTTLHKD